MDSPKLDPDAIVSSRILVCVVHLAVGSAWGVARVPLHNIIIAVPRESGRSTWGVSLERGHRLLLPAQYAEAVSPSLLEAQCTMR